MNKGDLVFYGTEVIGHVRRSFHLKEGQVFNFALPLNREKMVSYSSDVLGPEAFPTAQLRCIFKLGAIQHWSLHLPEGWEPGQVFASGWVERHTAEPSSPPEGVVKAIDIILSQNVGSQIVIQYLQSMRGYFERRVGK